MRTKLPRIIVAGLRGGAGKTTVALGIIAAWKEQGRKIVPYKKGPDYIDAGWLASAAGQPCFNLDPFLISREKIVSSFVSHYGDADCAVIEGNRGLYDGMDAAGTFSTAELAKTLRVPVILVIDCTKMTRTTAAVLLGMVKFDPTVTVSGVVLNQIAGRRHEKVIRESLKRYCDLPVVGALPKLRDGQLSERHMGLTPFQEHPGVRKAVAAAAAVANEYLDLDTIGKLARAAVRLPAAQTPGGNISGKLSRRAESTAGAAPVRIGIVRDSAFQFYYPENFEELEKAGAVLVEISALSARKLPDIDALYIGGGFPETHAIPLARNASFKKAIREAADDGLPIYAECGGLMYLGEALKVGGRTYPMAGVFPLTFNLEKRPQAHGYTIVKVGNDASFFRRGTILRGHEFHYSACVPSRNQAKMRFAFRVERGEGIQNKKDGIRYRNVLAAYTHLHALGSPEWTEGMIRMARTYREGRN